jgi:hypothetical protein
VPINTKLPTNVLYVTKDCDLTLSVRRRDPITHVEVDWDAQVYILVDVTRTTSTRVSGVVTGPLADIRIESSLLDTVRTGTTWRVVMSQDGTPRLETPIMVGVFERNDGK